MIFTTPLPFIKSLSTSLTRDPRVCADAQAVEAQRWWLSFA